MKELEMRMETVMRLCVAENEREREILREKIRSYLGQPGEDRQTEREIRRLMLELGAPDHLAGHPYAVRAIELVIGNRLYINSITFGLYPQLAARFDTTAARVERAIRHLVEVTWSRGDLKVLERYFGNTVSPEKGKPTNGEFIARLANVVKEKMKEDLPRG